MRDNENIIFRLDRDDYDYKGVLFAELDNSCAFEGSGMPPPPKEYIVGIMGIIWTDERGCWHGKMRLKFPSGNKQIITLDLEKEFEQNVNVNETYVLNELYKTPMINKTWTKNPDGTPLGIVEIIKELDMIENCRIEKVK